jgi:hypothetical protein
MPGKQEVTGFVRSTFRSVWSLELLCFLRKNRDRFWSQAEMVAALRGSDLIVAQGTASLAAAGLVVLDGEGAVRYQPAALGLERLVEATELLYARSPDQVRRLIVSQASSGAAAFADAFRLRKE